jgi:hypothetical protein
MNTPLTAEALLESAKLHPKYKLRGAWGEFIARWPWEWFATFTFSHDTHSERGLKLFRVWCSKLSRELYGPRWHKRHPYGVRSVVAVEYHKSGQIHLHALLAGVGDIHRLTWMDKWQELDELAGFPRIYAVEKNDAVSRYVTKYVTKDGEVYLSPNLRQWSRDLFDAAPSPESET